MTLEDLETVLFFRLGILESSNSLVYVYLDGVSLFILFHGVFIELAGMNDVSSRPCPLELLLLRKTHGEKSSSKCFP